MNVNNINYLHSLIILIILNFFNVLTNLDLQIDESKKRSSSNETYFVSEDFIIWQGSIEAFLEYFPNEYGQFIHTFEIFSGEINLKYKGNVKVDGELIYSYVLMKLNLSISKKKIENYNLIELIEINPEIITINNNSSSYMKNKNDILEFKNIEISKVLKFLNRSFDDIIFTINNSQLMEKKVTCSIDVNLLKHCNEKNLISTLRDLGLVCKNSSNPINIVRKN